MLSETMMMDGWVYSKRLGVSWWLVRFDIPFDIDWWVMAGYEFLSLRWKHNEKCLRKINQWANIVRWQGSQVKVELKMCNTTPKTNGWNLKITPLKRKIIWTKPPFWGSMLVFRGVNFFTAVFRWLFHLEFLTSLDGSKVRVWNGPTSWSFLFGRSSFLRSHFLVGIFVKILREKNPNCQMSRLKSPLQKGFKSFNHGDLRDFN